MITPYCSKKYLNLQKGTKKGYHTLKELLKTGNIDDYSSSRLTEGLSDI